MTPAVEEISRTRTEGAKGYFFYFLALVSNLLPLPVHWPCFFDLVLNGFSHPLSCHSTHKHLYVIAFWITYPHSLLYIGYIVFFFFFKGKGICSSPANSNCYGNKTHVPPLHQLPFRCVFKSPSWYVVQWEEGVGGGVCRRLCVIIFPLPQQVMIRL